MRKIHSKIARNYKLGDNQSLAQKLARIRMRVQSGGSYTNFKHPDAPKTSQIKTPLTIHGKHRFVRTHFDADNPNRKSFTAHEIECMWLSLCTLMAFFGGKRSLATKEMGFSNTILDAWVRKGRLSLLAADAVGTNPNIPFSREEMRPDMSPLAWQRFDKIKGTLNARRRARMKPSDS